MSSNVSTDQRISTLIVDDEQSSRDYLVELLENFEDFQIVGSLASSRAAIQFLSEYRPDCIFLDVEMPGMNGVGLCRTLDTNDISIVFVTAFNQYAVDAFEVKAVDYITKPIRTDRIKQSLMRVKKDVAVRRLHESFVQAAKPKIDEKSVVLNAVRGQLVFQLSEIQFLESSGNYVKVWLANKPHLIRETLSHLMEVLNYEHLVPIHRRFVVNAKRIRRLTRKPSGAAELYLNSEMPLLPVSRSKRQLLEDKLSDSLID